MTGQISFKASIFRLLKNSRGVLNSKRLVLLVVAVFGIGAVFSLSVSSINSQNSQYGELIVLQSPVIWSLDGEADYQLESLQKTGETIYTKGLIDSITANWEFKGQVDMEISADNGLHYTKILNGVPLEDRFVTGKAIKWKAILAENSELLSVKIAYTDGSGVKGTFGEPDISGFKYRKELTISNVSGSELYNYQLMIKIGESEESMNCDFYCDNIVSNFNDIRFTAADGETILPYYMESISGNVSDRTAVFWVKLPYIPEEGVSIYVYYSKPAAEDASDPNNVFDLYEDFDIDIVDLDKWEVETDLGGSYEIKNSMLALDAARITSKVFELENGIMEYRAAAAIENGNEIRGIIRYDKTDANSIQLAYASLYEEAQHAIVIGGIVKENDATKIVPGRFYDFRITAHGENIQFQRFSEDFGNIEASVNYEDSEGITKGNIGIETGGTGNGDKISYCDWIRVRKNADPEPSVSYSGRQEQVDLPRFSDSTLSGKGNIILLTKDGYYSRQGSYESVSFSAPYNISMVTPSLVSSGEKTELDISVDDGVTWAENCVNGMTYNASDHFKKGSLLRSRARLEDPYGLSNPEIDKIELLYSTGPVVSSKNIHVLGASGADGRFLRNDAITVEWDNSAKGDNNLDITGVFCNLSAFKGSDSFVMLDSGPYDERTGDEVYTARYELPDDIENIGSIYVTAQNSVGMTTRDGHVLTVNTFLQEAETEESQENEEIKGEVVEEEEPEALPDGKEVSSAGLNVEVYSPATDPEDFYLVDESGKYVPYIFQKKGSNLYEVYIKSLKGVQKYVFNGKSVSLYEDEGEGFIPRVEESSFNIQRKRFFFWWQNVEDAGEGKLSFEENDNGTITIISRTDAGDLIGTLGFDGERFYNKFTFKADESQVGPEAKRVYWDTVLADKDAVKKDIKNVQRVVKKEKEKMWFGIEREKEIKEGITKEQLGGVVVDWEDFKRGAGTEAEKETRAERMTAVSRDNPYNSSTCRVWFYEDGKQGDIEIDPVLSAGTPSTTLTVKTDGLTTSDFKLVFNQNNGGVSSFRKGTGSAWSDEFGGATELLTELDQGSAQIDATSTIKLLEANSTRVRVENKFSFTDVANITEEWSIYSSGKIIKRITYDKLSTVDDEARRVDDGNTDFIASGMYGYHPTTPAVNRAVSTYYDTQIIEMILTNFSTDPVVDDYQSPGTPSMTTGTLVTTVLGDADTDGFNEGQGCYEVAATTGNIANFQLDGTSQERIRPVFRIHDAYPKEGTGAGTGHIEAHYKCDETSGTSIADSAGSATGTASEDVTTDITSNTSVRNKAFLFDEDGEYFSATSSSMMSDWSKGTIEFWYKPNYDFAAAQTEAKYLFGTAETGTVNAIWARVYDNSDVATLEFGIKGAANQSSVTITEAQDNLWSAGDWVHLRFVWEDTACGVCKIYFNGRYVTQTHTDTASAMGAVGTNFYFGDSGTGTDNAEGIFDDIYVYRRAIYPYGAFHSDFAGSYTNPHADLLFYDGMDSTSADADYSVGSGTRTSSGADTASGISGNGIVFDASGDYQSFSATGNVNAEKGSASCWFKSDSAVNPDNPQYLFSTPVAALFINGGAFGNLTWYHVGGGGISVTGSGDVYDGKWHWVKVTWDFAKDEYYIYVDNELHGSSTSQTLDAPTISGDIVVGNNRDSYTQHFAGVIDEFYITSSPDTPEIQTAYGVPLRPLQMELDTDVKTPGTDYNIANTMNASDYIAQYLDNINTNGDFKFMDNPVTTTQYYALNSPSDLIAGGSSAAYAVTRYDFDSNVQTSGDETIYLYSDSTGGNAAFYDAETNGNAITSVTISDGQSTANFWFYDEKTGDWTITASDDSSSADGNAGVDDATDGLTVTAGSTDNLALNAPADFEAGSRAAYTVTRYDLYNNERTSGNETMYLYTSSSSANAAFYDAATDGNEITSVEISNGNSSANFWYYDDEVGTYTVTVSDATPTADGDTNIDDATDSISTTTATASKIDLSGASSVNANTVSEEIILTVQDAYDNTANPQSNTTFNLISNSGGGIFYSDAGGETPITQVTVNTDETDATFYYKDTEAPVTASLSVTVDSGDSLTVTDTHDIEVLGISSYSVTNATNADGTGWMETVTAKDQNGDDYTDDSSTQITMTSSSGNTSFYADGSYSDTKTTYTLSSGVATVYVKNTIDTSLTITATDENSKTGTSGSITVFAPDVTVDTTEGARGWKSPVVWRFDGKGDYRFVGSGTGLSNVRIDKDGKLLGYGGSGQYTLVSTEMIIADGNLNDIFSRWTASGDLTMSVSADNGANYEAINNGGVLTSDPPAVDFGTDNDFRWKITGLADTATINEIKMRYFDATDRFASFDERAAAFSDTEIKEDGDIVLKRRYTIGGETFKYRKAISIVNSTGAELTNHQFQINLDRFNLDFYDCKSDGSDIRFTDSDGSTKRDYYNASWSQANKQATVHVSIPSVPTSGKTIYMYYGNSAAASESDSNVGTGDQTNITVTVQTEKELTTYPSSGTYTSNTVTSSNDIASVQVDIGQENAMFKGQYYGTESGKFAKLSDSFGYYHTLAIMQDGQVKAWGDNAYGQLGNGTTTDSSYPVLVRGIGDAIQVVSGGYHSLALLKDGTIKAWGMNKLGQLGDGNSGAGVQSTTPVTVSGITNAVKIAACAHSSYALLSDGTVKSWGCNADGQLGDGTMTSRVTPVNVLTAADTNLTGVVDIAAGGAHVLALKNDGTVMSWGSDCYGQLGNGVAESNDGNFHNIQWYAGGVRTANDPIVYLTGVVQVSAGLAHSCALLNDGTIRTWGGRNAGGQRGDGGVEDAVTEATSTVKTDGSTVVGDAVKVVSGANFSLALLSNGTIKSWGYNDLDQCGLNDSVANPVHIYAVDVVDNSTSVSIIGVQDVGCAFNTGYAIMYDGTIKAWGQNNNGQIGDGSTSNATKAIASQFDNFSTAALYHFNEASGTTAAVDDDLDADLDGQLTNMAGDEWEAGIAGNCLHLDGSTDYVSVADHRVLDMPNKLTIEALINPDDVPVGDEYIIYRGNAYYLKIDSSRRITGAVYDADTAGDWITATSTAGSVSAGSWSHVALVFDNTASSDQLKVFINGAQNGTGTFTGSIANTNTVLNIGSNAGSNSFDGCIDEVRISSIARGYVAAQFSVDGTAPSTNATIGAEVTSGFTQGTSFSYKLTLTPAGNVTPEINKVDVTYGTVPSISAGNVTISVDPAGDPVSFSTYTGSTVIKGGDTIRVSWDNSGTGDGPNNDTAIETAPGNTYWTFSSLTGSVEMDEDGSTDIWIGDYSVPEGGSFDGTGNIVVTIANGYGNIDCTDEVTVDVDNQDPVISSVSPATNGFVNSTAVSYTLSEDCSTASGSITWTRTSGTADAGSPHVCALDSAAGELDTGAHNGITLANAPTLVDGAVYTMTYNVTDNAGNAATTITRTGITYDTTLPTISNTAPVTGAYVNDTTVSYTLSEDCSTDSGAGTITWTRTSGTADGGSPHTCVLDADAGELNTGAHTDITLTNAPSLVDGAVYTVTFDVTDRAGNDVASATSNTGVSYDITPPTVLVSITNGAYSSSTWVGSGASSTIKGTSADAVLTGTVKIAITRLDGSSDYWNGSNWTTATEETWINVEGGSTWYYELPVADLTDNTSYQVRARATDAAGNTTASENYASDTFCYQPDIIVSSISSSVTAGTDETVKVEIKDSRGQLVTNFNGTVVFTSTDPLISAGDGLPSNLLFVPETHAGDHIFTDGVTLRTAGTQSVTATVSGESNMSGSQGSITVSPATADHLKFQTDVSTPQTVGVEFQLPALLAVDVYGNHVNTGGAYTGVKTVNYSLNGTANSPDGDIDTWTTAVTFENGTSTTDLDTTLYRAQSTTITPNASDLAGTDTASNSITVQPGDPEKLSFYVQPSSESPTLAALVTQPQVAVADGFGNPCVGTSTIITLSASTTSGTTTPVTNGTLSGDDLTVLTNVDTGIAVFSGITYNYPEDIFLVASETNSADVYSTAITFSVQDEGSISAGGLSEPATISSVIDTSGEKIEIFDFKITDTGTDGYGVEMTQIVIRRDTGTDTTGGWTDYIAGATISDGSSFNSGTITDNAITFGSGTSAIFTAANGSSTTYTMSIWLQNSLPSGGDGKVLAFGIDPDRAVTPDISVNLPTTSTFGAGQSEITGSTTVDVTATKYKVTGLASATAGEPIEINIEAVDANNNRDTGYTYALGKNVVFSGASVSLDGDHIPICTNSSGTEIEFGDNTLVTFDSGVSDSTINMTLYRTEAASIKATVDSITTSDADDLDVIVSGSAPKNILWNQQPEGVVAANAEWKPFSVYVTDEYGNTASSAATITMTPSATGSRKTGCTYEVVCSSGVANFNDFAVYSTTGTYPATVTVIASGSGLNDSTASDPVTISEKYNVALTAKDSVQATEIANVTITVFDDDGNVVDSSTVSSTEYLQLPYGEYSITFNNESYVETTVTRTANTSADGGDGTYDNYIVWNVLVESIAESLSDYKVIGDYAYNPTTDVLKATTRLEKRGQIVTTSDTLALGTCTIEVYDGETLIGTITDEEADVQGNYWFTVSDVTGSPAGFSRPLVQGRTYFVKENIEYGGKEGGYTSGDTFNVDMSESISEVIADIAEVSSQISSEVADVKGHVTEKTNEIVTDLGLSGSGTISDKIDSVATTVTSEIKPNVRSGILPLEPLVSRGDTITVMYRAGYGVSPVIDVYDPDNTKKVSAKTMTEVSVDNTNTTSVYQYDVEFKSDWKLGDYTIVCSEATNGTIDATNIKLVSSDISDVAGNVAAVMGQTSDLSSLDDVVDSMSSQFTLLESALAGLGSNVTSSVNSAMSTAMQGETLQGKLQSISSELENMVTGLNNFDGLDIAKKLSVDIAKQGDVVYLKNKTQELKAMMELNQKIMDNVANETVIQTWYEYGSIILKAIIVNPSESNERVVPFKSYLPKEARPEHLLSRGGLSVAYDTQQGSYYVFGTFTLKPKEAKEIEIEIKDIWQIKTTALESKRAEAYQYYGRLAKTENSERAKFLVMEIEDELDKILKRQENVPTNPEDHISMYRENLSDLEEVDLNLVLLRSLMVQVKPMLTGITWRVVIAIVVFLMFLSLGFYLFWQRQVKLSEVPTFESEDEENEIKDEDEIEIQ